MQSCSRQAEYALDQQRTANDLAGARSEGERLACSRARAEAICQASDAQLKDLQQQHRKVTSKSCSFPFLVIAQPQMRFAAQHVGVVHCFGLFTCVASLSQPASHLGCEAKRKTSPHFLQLRFGCLSLHSAITDSIFTPATARIHGQTPSMANHLPTHFPSCIC